MFHRSYEGTRLGSRSGWRPPPGRSGWPFVDACTAMLRATGWLAFPHAGDADERCHSYQLWLDWHSTGLHLARLFTDYEPGIHWLGKRRCSQAPPASTPSASTTPSSKALDQDPNGPLRAPLGAPACRSPRDRRFGTRLGPVGAGAGRGALRPSVATIRRRSSTSPPRLGTRAKQSGQCAGTRTLLRSPISPSRLGTGAPAGACRHRLSDVPAGAGLPNRQYDLDL